MYCFYNPLELTEEQKLVYIKLLVYLAQTDNDPAVMERTFIKQTVVQMKIDPKNLRNLVIPATHDDLFSTLLPINGRSMAIDLLHRLWFAASIDENFADEEIELIQKIAKILDIDDETILKLGNFVVDEANFFTSVKDVFETDNVRC